MTKTQLAECIYSTVHVPDTEHWLRRVGTKVHDETRETAPENIAFAENMVQKLALAVSKKREPQVSDDEACSREEKEQARVLEQSDQVSIEKNGFLYTRLTFL